MIELMFTGETMEQIVSQVEDFLQNTNRSGTNGRARDQVENGGPSGWGTVPPAPEGLTQPIYELELSVRTFNGIAKMFANTPTETTRSVAKRVTIGELFALKREELAGVKGMGRRSMRELDEIMHAIGIPHWGWKPEA